VVAGGGLVTALALTAGVVLWLKHKPAPVDDGPVVLAGTGAVSVPPPDPPAGEGGSEPTIPQSLTVVFVPPPGQTDEEDVPAVPEAKTPDAPDPTLPAVPPTDFNPLPRAPKADAPRPTPTPKPAPDRPAKKPEEPPPPPPPPPADPTPKPAPKPAEPKAPAVVNGKGEFAAIDAHALAAAPADEATLQSLAAYLSGGAHSDREKARAAYRWVTDRIPYDVAGLRSGHLPDPTPAVVLRTRVAVCEGSAKLFNELCRRSGLEAVMVGGYAKTNDHPSGEPLKPDHAWSAVRCDGKWHLVDATWGAGSIGPNGFKKEFSDFYFLADPGRIIFTHLPEDEVWQLREPPLTVAEYARRPVVRRPLFDLGFTPQAVEAEIAAPGFRDVVHTPDFPGRAPTAVRAPLTRFLKAGTEYKFEFQSDDLTSFALVRNGQFVYLKREGKTFRGTIRPGPGPLSVAGRGKDPKQAYFGLLDYVVE
jgi:transglutaminase-like putative cysteine protease